MTELKLYLSPTQPCSYLPAETSQTLVVDPHAELDESIYGYLMDRGYRRSGAVIYLPNCSHCQLCIPVRLPVSQFRSRRIQRRIEKKWRDMTVTLAPPRYSSEHFSLFTRYLRSRHGDGDMVGMSADQYMEFLSCGWCETRFVEFRREGKLLCIAVVDILSQGFSSVYTFFDPDEATLSPGVYAILWQIAETRRRGLDWLYLGYWIPGCRKMDYKSQYRPLQAYDRATDSWIPLDQLRW